MTYVYIPSYKYTPDAELLVLMDDASTALKAPNNVEKAKKLKAVKAEIAQYDKDSGASTWRSVAGLVGIACFVGFVGSLFLFGAMPVALSLLAAGVVGCVISPSPQAVDISNDAAKLTTAINHLIDGTAATTPAEISKSASFEQAVTTAFNAKSFNKLTNALKNRAQPAPGMTP